MHGQLKNFVTDLLGLDGLDRAPKEAKVRSLTLRCLSWNDSDEIENLDLESRLEGLPPNAGDGVPDHPEGDVSRLGRFLWSLPSNLVNLQACQ
jgi:hypothetical protein